MYVLVDIYFVYLQGKINGCTTLQTNKECHDSVRSTCIVVANLFTWFIRQFEIIGNFNTIFIYKALTLMFTSMVRSEFSFKIYFNSVRYIIGTRLKKRNEQEFHDIAYRLSYQAAYMIKLF